MSSSRLGKKRQAESGGDDDEGRRDSRAGSNAHLPWALPDLTLVKPHEFIAQIKELSEDRYSRDVLAIFMKPVSPDEKLASLHQQWYKVRKPSADELWKAKQVVTKATDKKTALKSYVTLKAAYDLVSEAQAPQLSLHIAKMLIDYAMLVSYDAVEKRYEDELQDLMPDHHDLFGRLVARLESRTTRLSQAQSESSVEQPLREFVEHLRVDPERLSAGPSWDEILGCDTAKQDIQAAIELPRLAPQLAESISAWRGILLHGPPGTGKTALALSTAAVFRDCSVYHVKASNLMDKWLGATERNVSALFKVAEETGPSLIVLDEVEALLGTRQSSESAEGTT